MPIPLREYVVKGRERIRGWFSRTDAEIFQTLCSYQNVNELRGAVAEIGLHHGKSFTALCLSLQRGEKAYGIDLFGAQSRNLDSSGRGNRAIVEGNLAWAGIDATAVVLDGRASSEVAADDILKSVGAVRFFSVDGGHWLDVVRSDLTLAMATLAPHGIIALDDFLRPEWPEVSAGYFAWAAEHATSLVPFALGFNKLYFCRAEWGVPYKELLLRSELLRIFLSKQVYFRGLEIPVYQRFPLPEWDWRTRAREYLKLYHPEFYLRLRALRAARR
jgi:hypothetical protein